MVLRRESVDNNHHVAGKDMCVGFLFSGLSRRKKNQVESAHNEEDWPLVETDGEKFQGGGRLEGGGARERKGA